MKALCFSLAAFRKAVAPILLTLSVTLSISASWYQSGKITICHIPPGNPANRHTIEVSTNALQAHLDHGDYAGACTTGGDGFVKEDGVAYP